MSGFFQITNIGIEEGITTGIDYTTIGEKVQVGLEGNLLSIKGDFDTAEIYNMSGICVAGISHDNPQINTYGWQAGVYFVKVAHADTVSTAKVIIK